MLADLETGYEGKFDFPGRTAPPDCVYLLATVPRTGSSYLSHLLWQTGCLGAPLEYLNFDPVGPYHFAARSPDQQLQLWRSLLRRRTSPNGVFGVKCFPSQLEALHETNPPLLAAVMSGFLSCPRPGKVIHLARRDRVAHAVSYARASLTGIWRKEQEKGEGAEPAYSQAALETAERWIESQEAAWEAMFRDLRITPLRLCYEDVVAAPEASAHQVAAYLGVTLHAEAAVAIPPVLKQSEGNAGSWAALYAEAKGGAT